jgi:hypothetical protein
LPDAIARFRAKGCDAFDDCKKVNSQFLTNVYGTIMDKLNEIDAKKLHEIMQPLNIIRLSCGNIRARMGRHSTEDAEYLAAKLVRIEEQVVRVTELLQDLKRRNEDDIQPGDALREQ